MIKWQIFNQHFIPDIK